MSCMSQNFRLFHVSNLSVRNFRIFLLMYTGPRSGEEAAGRHCPHGDDRAVTDPVSGAKDDPVGLTGLRRGMAASRWRHTTPIIIYLRVLIG